MGETVSSLGEFGCIEAVCRDLIYRPELVRLGAGDDGAVYVTPPGTDEVISTDTMVEGLHFTAETMSPRDVGWKLCAANFSDMAAMGAEPAQLVISAALPKDLPLAWLAACYDGVRALCRKYRVNLLGGDMTGSPGGVILTAAVTGFLPSGTAVPRSGARPGDLLALTGTVGDSAAGRRFPCRDGTASAAAPARRGRAGSPESGGARPGRHHGRPRERSE